MKMESIVAGVIGLLVGIIVTGLAVGQAINSNSLGMMQMMGIDTDKVQYRGATGHDTMSMADMSKQLKDKTGDDFDKAFLEMMISHHEGAVDMAALIPARAKHDEIKTLGEEIIAAQTKEITDMKQWQRDWGYPSDEVMHMMHGNN